MMYCSRRPPLRQQRQGAARRARALTAGGGRRKGDDRAARRWRTCFSLLLFASNLTCSSRTAACFSSSGTAIATRRDARICEPSDQGR